jgi:hypothetical protein
MLTGLKSLAQKLQNLGYCKIRVHKLYVSNLIFDWELVIRKHLLYLVVKHNDCYDAQLIKTVNWGI